MIKSKQRSKPLKILTTQSKNKGKRKLSSIEKELLECYEKRQPVLLYGNDRDDCRRELTKEVWLAGGGVDQEVEYIDDKNNSTTKEQLENKFKKDWIDKYSTIDSRSSEGYSYVKELSEYIEHRSHITDKTWRQIDCGSWNGEQAHNELIRNISNIHHHDRYNAVRSTGLVMPMGYLFLCRGLVFLDNLHCRSGNDEDDENYRKLATVIHDRQWGSHKYDDTGIPLQGGGTVQTKFDWLVAYTHDDPKDFPKYFRERFKLISLDKAKKVKAEKEKITFDDVTLEMSVDSEDAPLFDAYVSTKEVHREKLPLEPGYLEPLHLLAYNVKHNITDGWAFNNDLDRNCNDGSNKAKYEIIKAFKKITGIEKRAEGIISIRHSVAKRLNIPRKNISFKRIS